MAKKELHIEIVSSSVAYLSSMSGVSRRAVRDVLRKHYTRVDITIVDSLKDLRAMVKRKPDLVFLGMKFIPASHNHETTEPQDIWVSDYIEAHGIACTGSGSEAHFLELHKPLAKERVLAAGLATAPFQVVAKNQTNPQIDPTLTYPLFVKPDSRGGGLGVDSASVVYDRKQLLQKTHTIATSFQSDSLVEEFLPGREFSVAILRQLDSDQHAIMPIELVTEPDDRGVRMLAGSVKSANEEQVLRVEDGLLRTAICELASGAFEALGARYYGRIDIRLDANNTPTFLEANLIPSLIDNYGSFSKSCALNQNLGYEAMIVNIVELGLSRRPEAQTYMPKAVLDEYGIVLSPSKAVSAE